MKSRSDYYKDWVDGNSDLTSYDIQTEQDKTREHTSLKWAKFKELVRSGKEETISKLLDLKDWNWPQNSKYVCMEYRDEYLQFHSSRPSCNFKYYGFEDNNPDEIIRLFHGTYHPIWVTSVVSKEEYEIAKEKLKHNNKLTALDGNVK